MASNANLTVNIGANTTGFTGGINQVTQQTQQLSQSLSKIGAAVGAAFAADRIISFAKEASQLAQVAEGVEMAFKRIGGDQIMGSLQKATKGTVSDLELMKAAVQANNFKIPLDQLGSLLAFAHQRAKDTGQSVDYLVNSIVMGIGRKSPLILDNLGISAVALKEKMGGIASEAATVGDVAKAVGEIASEEMAKVGASVETTGEKTAKVGAAFTNMKVGIGEFVNIIVAKLSPALTTFFNAMANGLRSVQDVINEVKTKTASAAVSNAMAYIDDTEKNYKSKGINKGNERQKAFEAYKANTEASISAYEEKAFWSSTEKENSAKQIKLLKEELSAVTDIFNQKKETLKVDGDSLKVLSEKVVKEEQSYNWVDEYYKTLKRAPITEDLSESALTPISASVTGDKGQSGLDAIDAYQNKLNSLRDTVSEVSIDISAMMSELVIGFAESVGEMIADTGNIDDFGKNILIAIGGFMKQLGAQMITMAFAGKALKLGIMRPEVLLAAGIALTVAGAAVSTLASSNPAGGSRSVSSGSYSGMSSNRDMKLEIVGMVKGTDIYWSQKRLDKQLNNTTVRSGR